MMFTWFLRHNACIAHMNRLIYKQTFTYASITFMCVIRNFHAFICFLTSTSFLVQIENYIKESMKTEMAQLQQSAVHNHTAAMLEMGTNLLSQTAEQTRKLTDVETQVTPQKDTPMLIPSNILILIKQSRRFPH